jgi:hypothetical protein
MDLNTTDPKKEQLYVASGDDAEGIHKPGSVYLVGGNGYALKEVGRVCNIKAFDPTTEKEVTIKGCLMEIDGISFKDKEYMYGWAQDAGLFRVKMNNKGDGFVADSAQLLLPARGEFEDMTWNSAGTAIYAVENAHKIKNKDNAPHNTTPVIPGTETDYDSLSIDHPFVYTDAYTDEKPVEAHQPDPGLGKDFEVGQRWWRYVPATGKIDEIKCPGINTCASAEIEAVDTLPTKLKAKDGEEVDALAVGYHQCNKKNQSGSKDTLGFSKVIITTKPNGKVECKTDEENQISVDFSVLKEAHEDPYVDIEGLSWPCDPWAPDVCSKIAYAKDSFNDSTAVAEPNVPKKVNGPLIVGATVFEIFGMAFKDESGLITIAVNGNLPIDGMLSNNLNVLPNVAGSAQEGKRHVDYGDIRVELLAADGKTTLGLYGIHFTNNNDSPQPGGIGLYEITKTKYIGGYNFPWPSFYDYNDTVEAAGATPPLLGHLDKNHFGEFSKAPTSIGTIKSKISDIQILPTADKVKEISGLEFTKDTVDTKTAEKFGGPLGKHTFGVSFDKPAAWNNASKIRISLFAECANDGIGLEGEFCKE